MQPDTVLPDPANPQAFNRYAYVFNRPLNLIDPMGHNGVTPTPEPPIPGMPPPPPPPTQAGETPGPPTPEEQWRRDVLNALREAGACSQWAFDYILANNIQFTFNPNPFYASQTGAQWTLAGNINIPRDAAGNLPSASDTWVICLVAHEAFHLAQGSALALSVVGEFQAFQYHHEVYRELTDEDINDEAWTALSAHALDVNNDASLKTARRLLVGAGGDHYKKYPLRPIPALSFLDRFRR